MEPLPTPLPFATIPTRNAFVELDFGNGYTLHAKDWGQGPPLLALHGFTGSPLTWFPLRHAAGERQRLIALSLPGHGGSGVPADPARIALSALADDIAALLDALGIATVAVLGYSLGGRAALHFALAHPDRVNALVLESASPGIADAGERAARVAADQALAESIVRDGIEAFVDRWEALPLWDSQRSLPPQERMVHRAHRLANRPDGLAASLLGAGAGALPSVEHRLHELTMPALLVAGALDAKYVAIAEAMHRAMPRSRLEIVEGAGHAVHLEQPDRFAALVLGFLGAGSVAPAVGTASA